MLERLRRSEAERERAVAQLIQSEKLASIGKIVAGVAHEVNKQIDTINTCIYNLEQDNSGPNRNLEFIKQGSERIERIVRQLSDFSRAATLELQAHASDRFFIESSEFGRMALKRYNVHFSAEDRCQPPSLLCLDKGKIQQVILNLLINAADASPPQGMVQFSVFCSEGYYCIQVRDHGSGIPDDVRESVFEIFYTTKPAGEGTGVGLAICKNIVEMHGGDMKFESRSGETTFTVRIPLCPSEGKNGCC